MSNASGNPRDKDRDNSHKSSVPSLDLVPLKHYLPFGGLMDLTGIGKTTLSEMLNPKSPQFDPSMPPAYQLTARKKLWKTTEVLAWIESRAVANGHLPGLTVQATRVRH